MGQYYVTVNIDKQEYLDPHQFGDGLKLLEFGTSGDGTMSGLAILLASGNGRGGGDLRSDSPIIGTWAGDRIVVAGDYADPMLFVTPEQAAIWHAAEQEKDPEWYEQYGAEGPTLYRVARTQFRDISNDVLLALADDPYQRDTLKEVIERRMSYASEQPSQDLLDKLGIARPTTRLSSSMW